MLETNRRWRGTLAVGAIYWLSLAGCATYVPQAAHRPHNHSATPARLPIEAPTEIELVSAEEAIENVETVDGEEIVEESIPAVADVAESAPEPGQPVAMTLGQLLDYARERHPRLAVRDRQVEVARADVLTAVTRDNPQFVMDVDTPVNEADPTQLSVRVMFPFHTAGKLARRRDVAWAGVRRACRARTVEEATILAEIVDAASDVVYLQELLGLQAELQKSATERAGLIPADFTVDPSGAVKITDKVQAETEAAKFELQQLETRRDLTVARAKLATAMGAPPEWNIELADSEESEGEILLPLEEVVQMAQAGNPAVAEALAAVDQSHCEHALAWAEGVPDFEFGPRYRDEFGDKDTDTIGARLGFDLPIFNRNQGAIEKTSAEIDAGHEQVRAAEQSAANIAAGLYRELVRVRQSAAEHRTTLERLATRYQTLIDNPLLKGQLPADQVLRLQNELLRQRLDELKLAYHAYRLRHRLELLIDAPLIGEGVSPRPVDDARPNG